MPKRTAPAKTPKTFKTSSIVRTAGVRAAATKPPRIPARKPTPNISVQAPVTPRTQSEVRPRSPHIILYVFRVLTWPLRRLWRAKWGAAYLIIFIGSLFILPSESARLSTQDYRYDANSVQLAGVPKRDVAIVLGGGDTPDNKPADYLRQRIVTAANLYKADRVEAIIMSGDNRNQQYNEPLAMKEHALRLGIPAEDILIDNAGYSTYDSCQRAKSVLQVSSATVITQGYHLPRAVMTCRDQGIDAVGLAAHRTGRDWTVVYLIREQLSTAKAFARTIF